MALLKNTLLNTNSTVWSLAVPTGQQHHVGSSNPTVDRRVYIVPDNEGPGLALDKVLHIRLNSPAPRLRRESRVRIGSQPGINIPAILNNRPDHGICQIQNTRPSSLGLVAWSLNRLGPLMDPSVQGKRHRIQKKHPLLLQF